MAGDGKQSLTFTPSDPIYLRNPDYSIIPITMDSRCPPHSIEHLLLDLTLAALLGIAHCKVGEAPLPRPAPLVPAL